MLEFSQDTLEVIAVLAAFQAIALFVVAYLVADMIKFLKG